MEFLSVVAAVYSLAMGINGWIDGQAERERATDEIFATTSRIQTILLALQSTYSPDGMDSLEKPVVDSVRGLGDVLKRTHEHLIVWKYKRRNRISALLAPSTHLDQLKADARQLDHQLLLLVTSLAVVQYNLNRTRSGNLNLENDVTMPVVPRTAEDDPSLVTPLDCIRDGEVKEFWRGYVGERIPFISEIEFRPRLNSWLGRECSTICFERLMLRLDEFGIGGITPSCLDNISSGSSCKDVLKMYMEDGPIPSSTSSIPASVVINTNEPKLPLLVWVDDNPMYNTSEVSYAHELGINVVQLTSTALAKAWIDEHSDFLKQYDHPSCIRFISDNHRDEPPENVYLNISAGENILRYLRGRHYNAPVLIYTGESISATQYVASHYLAGSTVQAYICLRFISALAVGGADDFSWRSFMAA